MGKTKQEEIKEIVEGKYTKEYKVRLGENRGQLFLRIPKEIQHKWELKKGGEVNFIVYSEEKERKMAIEFIE